MILYDSWTNIKNLVDTNNLPIKYLETDDLYKISVIYEQHTYNTELWINTNKVSGIDVSQNNIDRQDFEDNYKNNSQGVYNQSAASGSTAQQIEIIPQNKQFYKCATLDVNANESEYDLGSIYTDFTIFVTGEDDVILKFNHSDNDEIPLKGGQNIRDIIGADNFDLSKLYYKTTGSGMISQILFWAIK
jgi:hypothetical protein